jgi:hypothetical protein
MTKGKLFGLAAGLVLTAIPLAAQEPARVELRSITHATTAPLNSYVGAMHAKPNPAMPVLPWHHPQPFKGGPGGGGGGGGGGSFTDPDLQTLYGNTQLTAPLVFQGIMFDGAIPPDPNLSVGATQVVQIVNVEYDVYNKLGSEVLVGGAAPIHTIFAALGSNDLCGTTDGGDPIALYDKLDQRWVISQLAYNVNVFGVPFDFRFCLAISTSSDATGSYDVFDIPFGQHTLPDYPKLGVWSNGVYFSANIFSVSGAIVPKFTFTGAQACMFPRSAVATPPSTLTLTCTPGGNTGIYNILPADLEGTTLPPSGTADYYLQFLSSGGAGNTLRLYQFSNTPSGVSLNSVASLTVGTYHEACGGGTCVPQNGTTQLLDSLGDRLMYRLSYRSNSSGLQQMVVNHSVQISSSTNQTGIRWYRLCNTTGSFQVCQESTFSPDTSLYRWMGSIAQDKNGDLAMGYSTSSSATYPSVGITGRLLGTDTGMEKELPMFPGQGFQNTYGRWGDYSAISLDPDDCTFWYTNEYLQPPNFLGLDFIWQTVIGSFKFPTCQ